MLSNGDGNYNYKYKDQYKDTNSFKKNVLVNRHRYLVLMCIGNLQNCHQT